MSRADAARPWTPFGGLIYGVRAIDSSEYRYVGLTTKTITRRRSEHFKVAESGRKTAFAAWLRKQAGREAVYFHSLELVMSGELEDLGAAEHRWICKLREAGHRLLNLNEGGLGNHGYVWTEEQRAAASERMRGVKRPGCPTGPDHPSWGWTPSDELRARWSAQRKGMNSGASNPNFGKSASDETRAKMSAVRKGRPMPSSVRSAHTRYHTNKGVFKDTCRHCQDDRRSLAQEGDQK